MAVTFRYVYSHDALMADGNGEVKSCQANLVGTDDDGYEFSVTVRNIKNMCALDPRGRPLDEHGRIGTDDIDEMDCDCWCDEKLRLEDAPAGHLNARAFYEDHITTMLARGTAQRAAAAAMTDVELKAKRAPEALPRKSFMTAAPSD